MKPWTYLANNGPSTGDELPYKPNQYHKRDGIRKFTISGSQSSHVENVGRKIKCVYYIEGKHSPKTVLEAFFDANPNVREITTDYSLFRKISRQTNRFTDAAHDILGPFDRDIGGATDGSGDCPFCGEEYDFHLPHHLQNECEEQ